jgi:hypothetical protein
VETEARAMRARRNSGREVIWCYLFARYSSDGGSRRESEIGVLFGGKETVDPTVTAFCSPQGGEGAMVGSTRLVQVRRRRPILAVLLGVLLLLAVCMTKPWAFHIGGRSTPLLTWDPEGCVRRAGLRIRSS